MPFIGEGFLFNLQVVFITRIFIGKGSLKKEEILFYFFLIVFFYLGFLSRTFTTAGEGGGYFFDSSLPLPPASQTLRH